jgi:hypothetical protein
VACRADFQFLFELLGGSGAGVIGAGRERGQGKRSAKGGSSRNQSNVGAFQLMSMKRPANGKPADGAQVAV